MKIAIVYDRVNKWGGAERVLVALNKIFPEASLYTSVYNSKTAPWAKNFFKINTSFLQKINFLRNKHEILALFMPLAFESFHFYDYDLVISVTSEAAKGIVTGPNTKHICYCLTPTRYLWSGYDDYFSNIFIKLISKPFLSYLRKWDKVSSKRPDKYIAISREVQKRIKKYYRRESTIIFPPLKQNRKLRKIFLPFMDYYLVVSRLVSYKKVDIVIDSFNKMGKNLVIVGTGHKYKSLQRLAKDNIYFYGFVEECELNYIYRNAKALIMPQYEDFGLVAIEAQRMGTPVIAFKKGGSLDTIIDTKTGIFFNRQTSVSLTKAIDRFEKMQFDSNYIAKSVKKYNFNNFRKKFLSEINE